ncbi:MAG: HugZ family protein [Notoacmeibacter sp.]|nr:HugZ family protein [Notoacmeibacter sp.]
MKRTDPFQPVDDEARALARRLLDEAQHGALATLEPESGMPMVTRVSVARGPSGDPLIFISSLAAHTRALDADPRCSLLLGEPGKGDPMAHPRITLFCTARPFARQDTDFAEALELYLARNPKARLYAGFADFTLYRLHVDRAGLNGGFGRAWHLGRNDIVA